MSKRLYELTSIARPLEPAYRTNLAVLIVVPVIALLAAGLSIAGLHVEPTPARAAIKTALAAFGAWALTRELAPDDNPAAFASMLLAVAACALIPTGSLLPLFVTLFLTRIVNRSTGLAATLFDTLFVATFCAWVAWHSGAPLIAFAGAVAFALDAYGADGSGRSGIVAMLLALFAAGLLLTGDGIAISRSVPASWWLLIAAITAAYGFVLYRTESVRSVGDATGLPLSSARIRSAMLVGGLMAFFFVVSTTPADGQPDPLLFACLAGVVAGAVFRR